jgi:hypothetical protein
MALREPEYCLERDIAHFDAARAEILARARTTTGDTVRDIAPTGPPTRAEFDRLVRLYEEQKEATLMMARGIENLVVLYSHIHDAVTSGAGTRTPYATDTNTIEDI